MCVCMLSVVIMSLCLCFQCYSVDGLPHSRFPLPTYAPPQKHRAANHPRGPWTDPVSLVFPFLRPAEKSLPGERLMRYAFFWCQEFGTRLLEHKEQRGTERERERKGELLNNFSHMPTLQRTEGGRIPFWAPWGAELRRMDETATEPGAKGTLRQSSRFPFYYLVVSRDAVARGTRTKNLLLGDAFSGAQWSFI